MTADCHFDPWEIPTGLPQTPESETAPIDSRDLLVAKVTGIAQYQSPFDPDGWSRHGDTMRRRKDGTAATEYWNAQDAPEWAKAAAKKARQR
jgi:hypothetical protein